ncbi:hypothetical protein K2Q16_03565 [Patescibacteria group bacterium]|nr:hypothetical protein [Patescibacteria group bacterium]
MSSKTVANVFRVKSGKEAAWREWCVELTTQFRTEAEASLREEGLVHEAVFSFIIDGTTYVLGEMVGECLPANTDRQVNQKHKQMKEECLERVSKAEVLYSFFV